MSGESGQGVQAEGEALEVTPATENQNQIRMSIFQQDELGDRHADVHKPIPRQRQVHMVALGRGVPACNIQLTLMQPDPNATAEHKDKKRNKHRRSNQKSHVSQDIPKEGKLCSTQEVSFH